MQPNKEGFFFLRGIQSTSVMWKHLMWGRYTKKHQQYFISDHCTLQIAIWNGHDCRIVFQKITSCHVQTLPSTFKNICKGSETCLIQDRTCIWDGLYVGCGANSARWSHSFVNEAWIWISVNHHQGRVLWTVVGIQFQSGQTHVHMDGWWSIPRWMDVPCVW